MHQHNPLAGDPMLKRMVEDAVDEECADLPVERRRACVTSVSQRLEAEFNEMLHTGRLVPELITLRLRQEARRAIEPGASAA